MRVFTIQRLGPLFRALEGCQGVTQMEIHHPEGDVFVHTLQVLQWAFRESIDTDLILAAMVHDVGKRFKSKGHEKIAAKWLKDDISVKTEWLIENHMRIWYFILGDMKKLSKVHEMINHPWFADLALLARWDKLGRNPNKQVKYDPDEIVFRLNKCVESRFETNRVRASKIEDKMNPLGVS